MKISSTKNPTSFRSTAKPAKVTKAEPKEPTDLSFIARVANDPLPQGNKLSLLIPTAGGLALGAAAGVIGRGFGGGAALPGVAVFGVAGAALGSKLDGLSDSGSRKWTIGLSVAGGLVGGAGVVAGAVGGWPGAVAGALSLGGTGFAMGHLLTHTN